MTSFIIDSSNKAWVKDSIVEGLKIYVTQIQEWEPIGSI